MAGRSVNVELKVRAQDEASKALDAVAKSLKDLGSAGTALQGGSGGVGKFVEDLGKNLGNLDALFKKLDGSLASASKSYDLQAGRLAALNNSITERRRRIEELTATEARYQQQLSMTFVGPREQDVTRGALSKVTRDLKSQTTGLQADLGKIDGLIAKIADAREATLAIRGVQGEVAGAIRQTNSEYLKQIDVLNRLTTAEKAAGDAARQAAANRNVSTTVNRVTGVDRAAVDNTGIRSQRQADLERTFAPVFGAEDAKALRDAAAAHAAFEAAAARGVAIIRKEEQAFDSLQTYVQELRREFDRAGYAERYLATETAKLDAALKTVDRTTGKSILNQKEYAKALEAVKRKSEQLGEQSNPQLFGLNPYQTQNLLFQFNDVATQLASGTSLTQTLAQQGGQILQLFPKVGNTIVGSMKAGGAAIAGAVVIVGTFVVALNEALQAADRLRDLEAILRATADGANYNASELIKTAKSMRDIGIATEDAMKIVRISIKSGFDPSLVRDFGEAAKGLAVVLGSDVPTAAQALADALTGGYDALVDLDKQTNVFTDSELNNIRALIENGDALGANAEATRILTERYGKLADEADGPWDKAINKLSDSWERLKETLANSNVIQGLVTGLTAVANAISDIVDGVERLSKNSVGSYIFSSGFSLNPASIAAAGVAGAVSRGNTAPAVTSTPAPRNGTAPQQELDAILTRTGGGIKRTGTGFIGTTASDNAFYAAEIKRANELLGILKQQQSTARDTFRDALERAKAEGKVTTEAEKQAKLAADLKRIRVEVNRELGTPRTAEERRIAEELVQERLNKKAEEYTDQLKQIADARKRAAEQAEREAAAAEKQRASFDYQAKALLRQNEGFSAKAYWDVNAYRVGFGSDTVTRADGRVERVTASTTATRADAERDLERRIAEFTNVVKQQIGADRFGQFSSSQQAALVSIAYNYGELPKRILGAVKEGTNEQIAASVRGLRNDNGGVNAARRDKEAAILGAENLAVTQGAQQTAKEEADKLDKFNTSLDERLSKEERTIANQKALVGLQGEELRAAQEWQAVAEAIAQATDDIQRATGNPNATLDQSQIDRITVDVKARLKLDEPEKQFADLQKQVDDLSASKGILQANLQEAKQRGNTGAVIEIGKQIDDVNARIGVAAQALLDFLNTPGNPEALGLYGVALDNAIAKTQQLTQQTSEWQFTLGSATISASEFANAFTTSAVSAIDQFAQAIANGKNAFSSLWDAFRQFAADFLLQIAKMIQQQIIFNLISGLLSSLGGSLGGGAGAATNSFSGGFSNFNLSGLQFHSGGVVGSGGQFRAISPAMFANATRYHSGGIAGLKPGEVPSVLMQGEEVLTRDDPRHILNGGGGGGGGNGDVRIVNTFDAADFFSKAANSKSGVRDILNMVRENPRAFKSAMSGG